MINAKSSLNIIKSLLFLYYLLSVNKNDYIV